MRLVTAQELSFQDLPHISLPFIAQAEIKLYYSDENYSDKMSKVNDLELFLVSPSLSESLTDTLVSLKYNLDIEDEVRGHNAEHWQVHPQLIGLAKFNAELLIQRLTYQERIYGTHS